MQEEEERKLMKESHAHTPVGSDDDIPDLAAMHVVRRESTTVMICRLRIVVVGCVCRPQTRRSVKHVKPSLLRWQRLPESLFRRSQRRMLRREWAPLAKRAKWYVCHHTDVMV
jgi:hypothetical protein